LAINDSIKGAVIAGPNKSDATEPDRFARDYGRAVPHRLAPCDQRRLSPVESRYRRTDGGRFRIVGVGRSTGVATVGL
jgi:hypothetical protein